jgi:hypothetical protein
MRRAARKDLNQTEIVETLRRAGASVVLTFRLGEGIPDILVGVPGVTIVGHVSESLLELIESVDGLVVHHGANLLIEIKSPGGDLTDDEAKFLEEYRGQMTVVFSAEEALELIGR